MLDGIHDVGPKPPRVWHFATEPREHGDGVAVIVEDDRHLDVVRLRVARHAPDCLVTAGECHGCEQRQRPSYHSGGFAALAAVNESLIRTSFAVIRNFQSSHAGDGRAAG